MRFRIIEDHRGCWPVPLMCRVFRVSVAGYYAWRKRPESQHAAEDRALLDDIRQVHAASQGRYGSPRVHAALRAKGKKAGRGRVERLMRRHGVRGLVARPRRVRTTNSRHAFPVAPNLLDRKFTATAPNQVWLADLTYIPTGEGWLHMAAIMDLHTRKIVGCHARPPAGRAGNLGADDGDPAPASQAGVDPTLGPWGPICLHRLPGRIGQSRHPAVHEPARECAGQRAHGKLLSHAQD